LDEQRYATRGTPNASWGRKARSPSPSRLAEPPAGQARQPVASTSRGENMIFLGIVLLVLGFVLTVHILWILGIILLVIGVILALLGSTGRAIGGRAHYF